MLRTAISAGTQSSLILGMMVDTSACCGQHWQFSEVIIVFVKQGVGIELHIVIYPEGAEYEHYARNSSHDQIHNCDLSSSSAAAHEHG